MAVDLRDPEQLPGVSRATGVDLAARMSAIYGDAEQQLAEHIARDLVRGIASPTWAIDKMFAVGQLRDWTQTLLRRLDTDAADEIRYSMLSAYLQGGTEATRALAAAQNTLPEWINKAGIDPGPQIQGILNGRRSELDAAITRLSRAIPGLAGLQRMIGSLVLRITGTHLPVLRWAEDAYRQTIAAGALTDVLLGTAVRRRASQKAWERLLSQGITGFTDRAGRGWNLATYVEMATRTGVAQAAVEGHLDRLGDAGIDLVIVSNAPQECSRCRRWEGKVLARSGPDGARTVTVEHATSDEIIEVELAGTVDEAVAAGLLHPNCFPAEVLVSAPSGVIAADARRYEGPLVVIHTASGDELPVTPNHPILTPEGWVSAGQLQVGQNVLRYSGDVQQPALGTPGDQQVPARIGDVFDALRQASPMPPVRVPVAPEQFHGDGLGSDVDVVLANGELHDRIGHQGGEGHFVGRGMRTSALLADGPAFEVCVGAGHAANRRVRRTDLSGALLCRHGSPFPAFGFAAAQPDSSLEDPAADGSLADSEAGRQLVLALAGLVTADQVVNLSWREASCHVYNLQTGDGWYTANGMVVSNCRHSLSAYLPGVTRVPTHTADPEGDEARQHLRKLERDVRRLKLQAAAVIDPAAKPALEAKVRAKQAEIREHVKATQHLGIFRKREREQLDLGNS